MLVDVILVVFFILSIMYCLKKGIAKILMNIASIVLSIVIAYLLSSSVGNLILDTDFGNEISTKINTSVQNVFSGKEEEDGFVAQIENTLNIKKEAYKEEVLNKVTYYVFTGIGFGVVYIILRLITAIISFVVCKVFDLPGLKTLNKLGGIIIGVLLFFIEISVFFTIVYFTSQVGFVGKIVELINSSIISKALYDHNILLYILLNGILK